MARFVKLGLFVRNKSRSTSGQVILIVPLCRICYAPTDERAQRTRKLSGPRRNVAGRMLAVAVPCRVVAIPLQGAGPVV
jgi:hypothetical protein